MPSNRTSYPHETPRDHVVRHIVDGLYTGRYCPGQRITEAELTSSLAVSRGPVREAFNRLEAAGLISLTLQRGAQVRELTLDQAIGILVVVEAVIGLTVRYAAKNITMPGARESLTEALAALMLFNPRSADSQHATARNRFYAVLASISRNLEIQRILPGTQTHLVRVQFRAEMEVTNRTRHADYSDIAEAVMSGNASRAEVVARKHIRRAITALERKVTDIPAAQLAQTLL